MFSFPSKTNSRFPREDFSPHNPSPSWVSSRFSPYNSPQSFHSRNASYSSPNASGSFYSPRNTSQGSYSLSNSSPSFYSPRNTSQGLASSNSSPNFYSPGGSLEVCSRNSSMFSPHSSSSVNDIPLQRELYSKDLSSTSHVFQRNRPSFNNTSSYRRSLNSSGNSRSYLSDVSSGSPCNFNNRDHRPPKKVNCSEKGYNIRDYVNPSMLKDPWEALENESNK